MKSFGYIRCGESDLLWTCPACYRDGTGAADAAELSCQCGATIPDVRPLSLRGQLARLRAALGDAKGGPIAWEASEAPRERLADVLRVFGDEDRLLVVDSLRLDSASTQAFQGRLVIVESDPVVLPNVLGDAEAFQCGKCAIWLPDAGSCCPKCQRRREHVRTPVVDPQVIEHMQMMAALRRDGFAIESIARRMPHDRWTRKYTRSRVTTYLKKWERMQ